MTAGEERSSARTSIMLAQFLIVKPPIFNGWSRGRFGLEHVAGG